MKQKKWWVAVTTDGEGFWPVRLPVQNEATARKCVRVVEAELRISAVLVAVFDSITPTPMVRVEASKPSAYVTGRTYTDPQEAMRNCHYYNWENALGGGDRRAAVVRGRWSVEVGRTALPVVPEEIPASGRRPAGWGVRPGYEHRRRFLWGGHDGPAVYDDDVLRIAMEVEPVEAERTVLAEVLGR